MSLPIPNVGVDPGPDWASNLNSSLTILDQHNHSPGSGVQINPTGININADLPFNGNNAITLRSVNLAIQPGPLSGIADLGCLYVSGVDLWFNDENGNQIQMTSGGAVLATSSGITNGTASASFISSVLVVNAATNTPANIQAGSILLGNNVTNSKFLTLSPPNAMGANYGLVLPRIPAQKNIVSLDTSGNLVADVNVDGSTLAFNGTVLSVAPGGITRAQEAPIGQQVSPSSGGFSTVSGTPVPVTNLVVSQSYTGRPVLMIVQPDGTPTAAEVGVEDTPNTFCSTNVYLVRDYTLTFTVTAASATVGAVYSNNGSLFTVSSTISSGSSLATIGNGLPTSSGTLTKVSGTGDATISFASAVKTPGITLAVYTIGGYKEIACASSFTYLDVGATAGVHTYTVWQSLLGGQLAFISNSVLVVWEL